jgi:hypothetical protein
MRELAECPFISRHHSPAPPRRYLVGDSVTLSRAPHDVRGLLTNADLVGFHARLPPSLWLALLQFNGTAF